VTLISSKDRAVVVCDDTDWKKSNFGGTEQLDGFAFHYKMEGNGIILAVFKWSVNKLPPLWLLQCCLPEQCYSVLSTVTFFSSFVVCAYFSCRMLTDKSILGSVP